MNKDYAKRLDDLRKKLSGFGKENLHDILHFIGVGLEEIQGMTPYNTVRLLNLFYKCLCRFENCFNNICMHKVASVIPCYMQLAI